MSFFTPEVLTKSSHSGPVPPVDFLVSAVTFATVRRCTTQKLDAWQRVGR